MHRIPPILFFLMFMFGTSTAFSQQLGEVRNIELILESIPFSGDAKQANFISIDSKQTFSFNDMTWKDSTLSLYEFFHRYHEVSYEKQIRFKVKMIYLEQEVFEHKRYVGYVSTGKNENIWVLEEIKKM